MWLRCANRQNVIEVMKTFEELEDMKRILTDRKRELEDTKRKLEDTKSKLEDSKMKIVNLQRNLQCEIQKKNLAIFTCIMLFVVSLWVVCNGKSISLYGL